MEQANDQIIQCPGCGAKNRVPANRSGESAKCGKCHTLLHADNGQPGWFDTYTIRCSSCHAKNRIPISRIQQTAKCGKCKSILETADVLSGKPVMVTDADFDTKVMKSPLPVLLYCWSQGCPSCQMADPVVNQFASDAKGRVRVGKMNVASSPVVASRYNVLGVPYLLIFDNGQYKEGLPGAVPKHEIMMRMAHYL